MGLGGAGEGHPVPCRGPASKERPTDPGGLQGGQSQPADAPVPPPSPPAPPLLLAASMRRTRTTNGVSFRSQAFGETSGLSLLKLFAKTNGMFLNFLELWGNRPGKKKKTASDSFSLHLLQMKEKTE